MILSYPGRSGEYFHKIVRMMPVIEKNETKNKANIMYIIFFIYNNLDCEIVQNMTLERN